MCGIAGLPQNVCGTAQYSNGDVHPDGIDDNSGKAQKPEIHGAITAESSLRSRTHGAAVPRVGVLSANIAAASVAQLDRASPFGGGGRRFDSCRAHRGWTYLYRLSLFDQISWVWASVAVMFRR